MHFVRRLTAAVFHTQDKDSCETASFIAEIKCGRAKALFLAQLLGIVFNSGVSANGNNNYHHRHRQQMPLGCLHINI